MKWQSLLAALALGSTVGVAQTVNPTFVPLRNGTNYDIDVNPATGDLHMVFRSDNALNQSNNSNMHHIFYHRFTRSAGVSGEWSNAITVFAPADTNAQQEVSADIDTNQPAIAYDPVNDASWITF